MSALLDDAVDSEAMGVISDQLREAIEASGLSLYELAKKTDVNHGQLSRFLRGERGLSTGTIDKLADVLGLKLKYRKPRK